MADAAAWGPAAWKFLHAATFAYPVNPSLQEQRDAEALLYSLQTMLPCEQCRRHFINELAQHPPDTTSRAALSAWLVDLHNRINLRLNKPVVAFADAERAFSSQQCSTQCSREGATYAGALRAAQGRRQRGGSESRAAFLMLLGTTLCICALGFMWLRWRRGASWGPPQAQAP